MQISHPSLGSPNAMVTPYAELVVTGSVSATEGGLATKSVYDGATAMKFKNQMEEIILQLTQINTQLSYVTDEQLNKGG